MLNVFSKQPEQPNILELFPQLDVREDELRTRHDNENFRKSFEEESAKFKENPLAY